MRVKVRRCQAIKLILTGFVVVQENVKPSVLMHRPRKLGLYFKDLGLIFSCTTQNRLVCAYETPKNNCSIDVGGARAICNSGTQGRANCNTEKIF